MKISISHIYKYPHIFLHTNLVILLLSRRVEESPSSKINRDEIRGMENRILKKKKSNDLNGKQFLMYQPSTTIFASNVDQSITKYCKRFQTERGKK